MLFRRIAFLWAICAIAALAHAQDLNIIPRPQQATLGKGTYRFTAQTRVVAPQADAAEVADFFCETVAHATGAQLARTAKASGQSISFLINPNLKEKEGYRLTVGKKAITIEGATSDGLFYGMQSLLQLCPAEVEGYGTAGPDFCWTLPVVTIVDQPRFAYRGVHIDPCRHFLPVSYVKKQIDMLAKYKINKIHWHLTEDQAWRIEIKKYPELTTIGSQRLEAEGNVHKGFYTQEEAREVVAYAKSRHIEVIPELEIPGHELAAISAYPHLSCRQQPITPRIIWGVEDIVMCPGREDMFVFLKDVIDELTDIFPSPIYHIGGDESPRGEWKNCPNCQKRMKDLGLEREAQLQDYIIERVGNYLASKGKTFIGWNEILEGGNLHKDAIVMSWWDVKGGIEAARKGHYAVMTPSDQGYYFDHYQGDLMQEPTAIGGYSPISKVYAYDPMPQELKGTELEKYILGVQGNTWSEYITSPRIAEYRLYPRALALAEVAWTNAERKDYKDFCRRLDDDATKRLVAHHVNLHIPQPSPVGIQSNRLAFIDNRTVALETTRPLTIVYTTDGTDPTPQSPVYSKPLSLSRTTVLKAACLLPNGLMSGVRTLKVEKQEPLCGTGADHRQKALAHLYKTEVRSLEQLGTLCPDSVFAVETLSGLQKIYDMPADFRNVDHYTLMVDGSFFVPETGVYEFSTTNATLAIDGIGLVNNTGIYAPRDTRENTEIALEKGYHTFRTVFIGGIFGGFPTYWNDTKVRWRPSMGEWTDLNVEK
ncbi:MAG: family 20 glycosylhydrolase [Alloprevotella sp.]|nr:family 20 glycosylhydrolase [Alloprevotella sp.]